MHPEPWPAPRPLAHPSRQVKALALFGTTCEPPWASPLSAAHSWPSRLPSPDCCLLFLRPRPFCPGDTGCWLFSSNATTVTLLRLVRALGTPGPPRQRGTRREGPKQLRCTQLVPALPGVRSPRCRAGVRASSSPGARPPRPAQTDPCYPERATLREDTELALSPSGNHGPRGCWSLRSHTDQIPGCAVSFCADRSVKPSPSERSRWKLWLLLFWRTANSSLRSPC